MKSKNKWYKLENAAKIFPPTSTKEDPKVFRFFVELKEAIEPICLQKAVDETIEEFPLFKTVLKKGLFWYYLEYSNQTINVEKERTHPCERIKHNKLCRITYYNRRINVEVNHALTDGTGTLDFLKLLTSNYLVYRYKINKDIYVDDTSIDERTNDSFNKYYKKNKKTNSINDPKAYQLKGEKYDESLLKITEIITDSSSVLEIAKFYNTTVTVYLTALMINSIASNMTESDKKKPIVITIPVNLRKYFPSKTARNFFNVISIIYNAENNNTLEEIIIDVDKQFKDKITKSELKKRMNGTAYIENLLIIRLIPIFIKDIILKYIYLYTRRNRTMTISNIGVIKMPNELEKYINLFGVYSSSENMHSCMCSFNNTLVFTFASHFLNSEIQRSFVKYLVKNGVNVIINTNNIEGE